MTMPLANKPIARGTARKVAAQADSAEVDVREARLLKVANLYCQGKTQRDIAETVGVSQPMVCADLKLIRAAWLEEQNIAFGEAKAREIAKIDHMEAVAWEAWFKSCRDAEVKTRKTEKARRPPPKLDGRKLPNGKAPPAPPPGDDLVPIKQVSERRRTGQTGNPEYLRTITWCIETRVKILGLIKDVTINNNFINWEAVAQAALSVPDDVDPIEQRILNAE